MSEYTVVCLFVHSNRSVFGYPFQLSVPPTNRIRSLKPMMLERNDLIRTFVPEMFIRLWMLTPSLDVNDPDYRRKCSALHLPDRRELGRGGSLSGCDEIRPLNSAQTLQDYWPDAHHLPTDHIHVLVQLYGPSRDSFLQDLNDMKLVDEKVRSFSLQVLQSPSPHETVRDERCISQVYDETSGYVLRGRPAHNFGPPTSLFNSALARLKNKIDSLDKLTPSAKLLRLASDFIIFSTATGTFNRSLSLINVLSDLFPIPQTYNSSEFTCTMEHNGQEVGYVFGVVKEENGLGGDATLHAACQYSKAIAELRLNASSQRSNYPGILIAVMGTSLEISAVISLDSTCIDRLLVIDLLQRDDEATILQLGRTFAALVEGMADLGQYYSNCLDILAPENPLAHFYPCPTSRQPDEYFPELVFWSKINHDGKFVGAHDDANYPEKQISVYFATLKNSRIKEVLTVADPSGGVDVVVKFTKKYNERAHRILADKGLAPQLYYCSRIAGGLYMVVMKRACGIEAHLYEQGISMPSRLTKELECAVRLLHQADIVHGDLRLTNILITDEDNPHIVVIDFDWAGVAGKDRYPPSLNDRYESSGELRWAPGVERYGVMMVEHDHWQLERFREYFVWKND